MISEKSQGVRRKGYQVSDKGIGIVNESYLDRTLFVQDSALGRQVFRYPLPPNNIEVNVKFNSNNRTWQSGI